MSIDRKKKAWRRTSFALVVVAAVLLPLSMTAIWIHNMLLNTDRYVATVAPLAGNEDIDQLIADRVTNALVEQVDVASIAKEALPESAQFLAQPLALAVELFVNEAVLQILQSDQFAQLWEQANRVAHEQLVGILTGTGPVAQAQDKLDDVNVDLSSVVSQAQEALAKVGLTQFENVQIGENSDNFTLFYSEKLERVQRLVDIIQKLHIFLPLLTLATFVGGVLLAQDRRRAIVRVGVAVIIASLFLFFVLWFGHRESVNTLGSDDLSRSAASAAFDILTTRFRAGVSMVMAVGIGLWIGAWLIGPGYRATRSRDFINSFPSRVKKLVANPTPAAAD